MFRVQFCVWHLGFLFFLLSSFSAAARAAVLTVGAPGTGCNHTDIQAAVNAAQIASGSDTIRIARSGTYTALAVVVNSNEELILEGGYATCNSAAADGQNTNLSGAGGESAPVLTFRGNGGFFIRGLDIIGGDHTPSDSSGRGGGIFYEGGGVLDIADAEIAGNSADFGGGIYALGTSTAALVVTGDDVVISGNTARKNGGGLAVYGIEFEFRGKNSTLLNNEALGTTPETGFGGGAHVASTSNLRSYLFVSARGLGGLGAIHGNRAKWGGGVAVRGAENSGREAQVRIFSATPGAPIRVIGNSATVAGGAIHVRPDADSSGAATAEARVKFAVFGENFAPTGAVVFLAHDDGGVLGFDQPGRFYVNTNLPLANNAAPCPVGSPCSVFFDNLATAPNGAVFATSKKGRFEFVRTQLFRNQGGYLFAGSEGGVVSLASVLIDSNTVTQELAFLQTDASRVEAEHLTVAGNTIGGLAVMRVANTTILRNSLFSQPGKPTVAPNGQTVQASFVLTNETTNMTGGNVFVAAPRFIDPVRGDYRLRTGSFGVDFATTVSTPEDLLGAPRVIDVVGAGIIAPNRFADVGAFERIDYQPLVLNAGFDFDLNLWSFEGLTAQSAWDGTQNVVGPIGSGSARVVFNNDPARAPNAERLAGRGQCIHLPAPGTYRLNAHGRVVPSSNAMNTNRARLTWALRYNGGLLSCENGAPNQTGILNLATTSGWTSPSTPALIDVPAALWTPNTSVTVLLDVLGGVLNPPTAWFDGIILEPVGSDIIFADGFQ